MYKRTLKGFEKAIGPSQIRTYVPALNSMWGFASLRERQGCEEDAREWYSKALSGYEKVLGSSHSNCQTLRDRIETLESREDRSKTLTGKVSEEHVQVQSSLDPCPPSGKPGSKRHRLLKKLGLRSK
ncbi:hypothetical protein BS50DRAFT_343691 [Corynespora cassiicola Philippines]|uniref:Kinesin light chain n=1 Tax=Corynespora cassiicola Philippines TaxID=1448308 RepID=A0A2T2N070_CORCC|nr:hypothetical protein BS50DRAFT_367954 [Corynespora cassiicola Philippines]PSN58845.1 hypothetical protein BS50DRAFT_343691 [Corynespora cassiicola Philippines]